MLRRIALLAVLVGSVGACAAPSVNAGTVSAASGQTSAAGTAPVNTPTWGQRYTWQDGLAVQVSAPTACKPSESAAPQGIQRAVKVRVMVINGTGKPFDASAFMVTTQAQFNSAKADEVTDMGGPCGDGMGATGTILQGQSLSFDVAYSVAKAPGRLQVQFQPEFGSDEAVFVGQA